MVSKTSFGVSGMDKIDIQAVMDDGFGEKNMEVEYSLDKEAVVIDKITKLPGFPIEVTVKRCIIGFMDDGIDG